MHPVHIAFSNLSAADGSLWLPDGRPDPAAVSALVGRTVTAAEIAERAPLFRRWIAALGGCWAIVRTEDTPQAVGAPIAERKKMFLAGDIVGRYPMSYPISDRVRNPPRLESQVVILTDVPWSDSTWDPYVSSTHNIVDDLPELVEMRSQAVTLAQLEAALTPFQRWRWQNRLLTWVRRSDRDVAINTSRG